MFFSARKVSIKVKEVVIVEKFICILILDLLTLYDKLHGKPTQIYGLTLLIENY